MRGRRPWSKPSPGEGGAFGRGGPSRAVDPGAAPPLHGVMARLPTFAHFDQKIADTFKSMREQATGLPGYLGIRFVEMTPGRLVATMPVRDELLTPFKTLHGGVMAGLVDHVLGCVLYPLMPRGQWAATT